MLASVCLLGVHVSRIHLNSAVAILTRWVQEKAAVYVCVAPVSTLVEARQRPEYAAIVNGAAMVTPDGMPVVWLARAQGCQDVGRTYGPDVLRAMAQVPGLKHYFFGGTPEVLEKLTQALTEANPDIHIAGTMSPPFRAEAAVEEAAVHAGINDANPDIVWVGLGSPKQDFWMAMNRPYVKAPVMIGVGAAFDFVAGVKKQAPVWIQRSGFEWLFRLCTEPRRLWKRYLVGNTMFIYYLIKDSIKRPACA